MGVAPGGEWIELDLNPHCSDTLTPDEVDFILYWLPDEDWPHVELTTNGPACIPSSLYRFNPEAKKYVRVREACAA